MITFSFSGTSHGEGYRGTICGLPKGFVVDVDAINQQLALRKSGYGRSSRQIYPDVVQFDGEQKGKLTVGGDVTFFVANAKVENRPDITALRSGHADVTGKARYPQRTVRQIAEIASARNSLCYVVLGAICAQYLQQKGICVYHYVTEIGGVRSHCAYQFGKTDKLEHFGILHCPSAVSTKKMCYAIDTAAKHGNSLGGCVTVGATGVPMGIGEILPYTARLDAQISANVVGIPSVKGIAFGNPNLPKMDGLSACDMLVASQTEIAYQTNNCGGIVGGITTGQDILFSLTVKPVPTVKGATTVDAVTRQSVPQHYERADVCVVPNVGVIAQNVLAYVLLNQMLKQGETW